MRNISVFGTLCMICTCCLASPSLRASSIPLNHQPTMVAPKGTTTTTTTTSDSTNNVPVTTTTTDATTTNDARISFTSPLKQNSRYYVPTGTSAGTGSSSSGGGTTTNPTVTADIAAIQQQIDNLLDAQQQMADSVRTTVQNEIKNSDLTKNASFTDAVSTIQESAASMDQVNAAINEKVNDTLVEKGIVNNRGQLLVATTEEIQPLALSQKLDSTLSTKFAKKSDVTPTKIVADIATNQNAVQTLAQYIGTNEDTVKTLIASDLKQRGIITPNNTLNVATKSELPVINSETVTQALQTSGTIDNMISQNLITRGLYNSDNQLQVLKKSELTPELLTTKLGNTYATTSDISTENLSNKLNGVFVTPTALRDKNYATKSEIPVINEATVSAALANSSTLDNTVIANLKRKNILDANENLNVATKAELQTSELQQQINNIRTTQTNMAQNQLTRDDIASTVQTMDLTTANTNLSNALDAIRTSTQALQTSVTAVQNKANNISENLDSNIDSRLRDRGLMDSNGKINANALPSDVITSTDLADYAKTADILENGVVKSSKLPTTLVTKDPNGKISSAVLPSNVITANDLNGYAKTSDIMEAGTVKANLLPDNLVTKNSSGKIDSNVLPSGLVTSGDLADYAKTSDILEEGKLKVAKLPDTVVKTDVNGKIDSNVLPTGLLTSNDLADYAKTSDILENGVVKATKLPDTLVTKDSNGKIDTNVLPTGLLTSNDLADYAKTSDILENGVVKSSKLPDTLVTKDINGKIDSNVLPTGLLTSNDLADYAKTSDILEEGKLKVAKLPDAVVKTDVNGKIDSNVLPTDVITTTDLTDYAKTSDILENGVVKATKLPDTLVTKDSNGKIDSNVLPATVVTSSNKDDLLSDYVQTSVLSGYATTQAMQEAINNVSVAGGGSYSIKGSVATYSDLADTTTNPKSQGTGYIVNADGMLYVCSGTSSNASECTYPSQGNGISVRGEKGASFNFTGNCNWSSTIPGCNNSQEGNACAHTDGKLYICSCTGSNCEYKGTQLKGTDGVSPKSLEQQYCEDNFAIVQQLYPNNGLSSTTDCADTSKFSNANYTAIMGGAKAYCLSLARDPSSLGDLSSGIGKRLSDKLGSKMTDFISVNKSPAERLALTGFKTSKTNTSATGNFMTACEARYDEIMAGADGADGISGDSAAETWCKAHSAQYTDKQTNQVVAITSPTALSASKGLSVFNVFKNKKSLTDNQIATKINTTTRIFASVEDCLAAVAEDPDIMTGKSAADSEFDKTNSELVLNSTNLADLNTFRSTGFKNTLKGKDGTGYTLKGSVNAYSDLPSTGNTKGDGWYVKANGLLYVYACESGDTNCAYPALADGVPIKGDPGENGLTYIPEINNGMLKWKNPEGTYYNLAEVKVRGDDGITYEPSVSDAGILTWKNKATGVTVEALGSKNIKGPQGNPGTNGSNGKTYQPSVASDGTLSWTVLNDGTAPSVNSINIKGPQGNPGTNGSNGKTYQPSVAADGTLSWTVLNDGTAPSVNSINIKGPAGENGVTFTPAFNSTTGNLSWTSSKAGVTAPEPVKIAKTDSELQTLVDGRITADTTLARQTDIQNFLTGNDLTPTFLAGKLGNTYLKDSDLTASVLEGKLGSTYTKTSDVNGLILADLQGRGIVSTGDNPQSLFATKAEIAPAELATSLGNTFAAKSSFDTLSGTVGGLTTTVNKLDGPATTSGSIAYQLANSGFAKTSDILENGVLKSDKVPGNLVTSTSLSNTLSGYTTASDFTALSNNAVTPDNIVNTFKQKFTGNASTGDAYSTATSLENLIKAIAADVARDVSVQVSEHVAKQVSSQVSDRVAKRRINEISDSLITPTKLTNFITNGIQTDDNGTVSLKTTNGGTCSAEPVFGKSGNTGSSTCGTGGSALAVNLSTSEALFDNVPASNTDGITADLTGLNISLPSYFTTVSCSTNQYVNTDTNQCAACPTGSTSNGGTVTSCTCSSNYYKSGNTCLPCGTGATSGGGNTTSCSCTATGTVWSSGANGGSCAYNQTACLNAPGTYWDNDTCKTLPAHSSRTSSGTGFECNAGYYWNSTQSKCLYCGNNATSEQGATSCTCKSGTWSPTSSGGTCAAQSETCSAIQIENKCLNTVETCNMYNQLGLTWMDKYGCQCTDNRYFNTHDKTCVACPTGQGAIIDETTHLCSCPAGQVLNTYQGRCVACEGDGITYKDGACTCTNGGTLDFTGAQLKCTA